MKLTVRVDQLQVGDVLVPTERRVAGFTYTSARGKLAVLLARPGREGVTSNLFGKSTTVTIRREEK
jgi:hypothetical protein